jgi:GNAT superfamily N-acetyltransferase
MIVPAEPSEHHQEAILAPLLVYNESQVGRTLHEPVAILLQGDAHSEVVGGLWGKIYYEWLFVELLFVPENLRGARLGSQMIAKAEDMARQKNCVGVWLDTFSFQAPEFYRKLGYDVFGSLDNYPTGRTRFFLQKRFTHS